MDRSKAFDCAPLYLQTGSIWFRWKFSLLHRFLPPKSETMRENQ